MINNNKNNKGFTLIELIIVIAIIGIVFVSASNLFIYGYKFYNKNKEKAEIQRELRFITTYIDENIKYASNVELYDSKPTPNANEHYIGFNGTNIVSYNNSERILSNIEINSFQIDAIKEDVLNVTIEKNSEYQIETNFLLNNSSIDLTTSPANINYILFNN